VNPISTHEAVMAKFRRECNYSRYL